MPVTLMLLEIVAGEAKGLLTAQRGPYCFRRSELAVKPRGGSSAARNEREALMKPCP